MTDSVLPVEILEERAVQQRRQIHNLVEELRYSVRDRLGLNANIRQHWGSAGGGPPLCLAWFWVILSAHCLPPLVVTNPAIKALQARLVWRARCVRVFTNLRPFPQKHSRFFLTSWYKPLSFLYSGKRQGVFQEETCQSPGPVEDFR